jgi:hypothetical protein
MEKTEIIILRDFAEQINIQVSFTNLERTFYTKLNKWPHSKKVWLYIDYFEQWYEKYLFDEKAAIFIADNLEFNNLIWHNTETGETSLPEKKKKIISQDLICKFNLVRIIPKGGTKYFESYIRVVLKDNYEIAKPISDQEIILKNTK